MTLGQKQRKFARLIAELITWAYRQGYELSVGDFYRDPRVHGMWGAKESYSGARSLHKQRCAADLNLFIDGEYQTSTEAYRPLGEHWMSLDEHCEWGGESRDGDYRGDGNHFSFCNEGRW